MHLVHGIEWYEAQGEVFRGWRFEHLWKKHRCPHRYVAVCFTGDKAWLGCPDCKRQVSEWKPVASKTHLRFTMEKANTSELERPLAARMKRGAWDEAFAAGGRVETRRARAIINHFFGSDWSGNQALAMLESGRWP